MAVVRLIPALAVLCVLLTARLSEAESPASRLLETLFSSSVSEQEWLRAADAFRELPAEVAIKVLFPEISKGIPDGRSYASFNCSDARRDRKVAGWGSYCVANWLWCQTITSGDHASISRVLLALWIQPQSEYGKSLLLSALDSHDWVAEAEDPVQALFKDSQAPTGLRAHAASCLLHHLGTKYHQEVVQFALFSSRDIRDFLFRQIASTEHARASGVDRAVVRMGFWLMLEELTKNEERFAQQGLRASYYGAFLFANALGTYLGEGFTPDYKLAKYRGQQGTELWYRETSENALAWWLENEERYAN